MRRVLRIIIAFVLLSSAALSFADTLVDRKTGRVVGVGNAVIENQIIHWTPCHAKGGAQANYSLRKYKVIQGDNCNIAQLPQTGSPLPLIAGFGLLLFAIGLIMRVRSGND